METTNYLTAEEVQAVQSLHTRAPYSVTGVSQSIFSVARYCGGMVLQGCEFSYVGEEHDECVRNDVLKIVKKMRKLKKRKTASSAWAVRIEKSI